jgi:hypothetical protein
LLKVRELRALKIKINPKNLKSHQIRSEGARRRGGQRLKSGESGERREKGREQRRERATGRRASKKKRERREQRRERPP